MSLIDELFAKYYNAVSATLGSKKLQLALSGQVLAGTNDEDIWAQYNQVPRKDLVGHPSNSQFSSDYGGVITKLKDTAGQGLDEALGSNKEEFKKFMVEYQKKHDYKLPDTSTVYNWALTVMSPGQATQVATEYGRMIEDPVAKGIRIYNDADFGNKGTFPWQITEAQVSSAVQGGKDIKIHADHNTSSDVSGTWAGKVDVSYDSISASAEADGSWSKQFAESFSIDAKYYGVAPLQAAPLYQPYPDLPKLMPWYDSATFDIAANQRDKWKNPPDYDHWFGPDGSFLYQIPTVVFCRSFEVHLEAKVKVAEDQQAKFKAAVEAGFWPFYAKASGSVSYQTHFESGDTVKIDITSGDAGIYVLGYDVEPTKAAAAALARDESLRRGLRQEANTRHLGARLEFMERALGEIIPEYREVREALARRLAGR